MAEQAGWQTTRISKLYRVRNRGFAKYIPLNKPEAKALDIAVITPGWITFDNRSRRAVFSLEHKGLVEVYNQTGEYRLAEKFR